MPSRPAAALASASSLAAAAGADLPPRARARWISARALSACSLAACGGAPATASATVSNRCSASSNSPAAVASSPE